MTWNDFLNRAAATLPDVDWTDVLPAVLASLVTILVLKTGLRLATRRLRSLSQRTANEVDDALVQVLEKTSGVLLWMVGLLVGLGLMPLDDRWHGRVSQLWFAVVALQLGLWGQQAVSLMLHHHAQRHAARHADNAALTASATLLGWGLRGALWVVVLLAVLSNLGVNITAFVASLGIGGIAVALAVQNILGDLFASLSIAVDKPFEVGDSIAVDNVNGTVERVGLKTTRIRSLGGEQIVMSNAELLKRTVSNYKRLQTRRVQFGFGVTYDTTVEQLAEVPALVKSLIEADKQLEFLRAHFKAFGESSLDFEVVYRVLDPSYDVFMDRQQALNLGLMRALQERGIDFAFPTRTVHLPSAVGTDAPARDTPQTA